MRCDLFCKVVDHFGDAGVCWRLARQLVHEHGWTVRLWIDILAPLMALAPEVALGPVEQTVQGVQVRHWTADGPDGEPAPIVIEAFGCMLPEDFIERMARQPVPPLWINLEYLSAESWVASAHALPSPHPRLPLTKMFFFPGFDPQTGGLIRESGLAERREAFLRHAEHTSLETLWDPALAGAATRHVSLFCYENPAIPGLLKAWRDGPEPIQCWLPTGTAPDTGSAWRNLHPGQSRCEGRLTMTVMPFLPQDEYDQLLWSCDMNFVRGEDSFLRAQYAARPMLWHIYPQSADAHWPKLHAWEARYTQALAEPAREAWLALSHAWNAGDARATEAAWRNFSAHWASCAARAKAWEAHLSAQRGLAERLAAFCADRLQ